MLETYKNIYTDFENMNKSFLTEKQIQSLKSLNIHNIFDLLYYFPRAYDDRTNMKKIGELRGNEYVVIKANILFVSNLNIRNGKKMVKVNVTDGTGIVQIIWFGMPYIRKTLKVGEEYIFIGQIKKSNLFQLVNPEYKLYSAQKKTNIDEILPIYSTNKSVTQNTFRKISEKFFKKIFNEDLIPENIPENLIEKYKIIPRFKALKEIHYPSSQKNIEDAKRRFTIEELLILEFGILKNRFMIDNIEKEKYIKDEKKDLTKKFLSLLSFELTRAQKKVITEIYTEILSGKIINRLLQGDVGSGKTIVATLILIFMAENGFQGALMAPTEILANQHFQNVKDKLNEIGLTVELLTSSVKGKKKETLFENIKNGEVDIIIGTHSLIEDNVEFKKLGLIVIDEQHRFGVNQRNKLREKGYLSNLLVMSATPIPRSLALSIYGDLDLSIIDELPPGRMPIKTKWISNETELEKMYNFIYKKIEQGNQAYLVAPLIEESEKMALESVDKLYENIKNKFSKNKIEIIHGKMKAKEKDEIMKKFKDKEFEILIATTVIEVGIDVPNSTIMCIYNAERFGLSALHQLRGRVGRGDKQSYCFLISYSKTENSAKRLSVMEETEDGFKIAEEDLKLRNSGEIFGLRQSGFSDLKFIDIIYDTKTIKMVRDECVEYLKNSNGKILNPYLRYDILKKFNKNILGNN